MAAALAASLTACGGSGADKAGGTESDKPVVLTLESDDDFSLTPAPEFAEAVERLSDGSLRVRLIQAGRLGQFDSERRLVQDVRRGRAQLGIVGVRVWDTLGVTTFRGLVAPFLIDSWALQEKVLASRLALRMLEGVESAGVVGLAVLPGPLRRPFGISRSLVGRADYRGAWIGIVPSGVAKAAFRALGAEAAGYAPGLLSGFDGAELDPATIASGYDVGARALTVNVVLWPKPFSIIMNRRAFEVLTRRQREILRRAGREAAAPELRQLVHDEAAALVAICGRSRLTFVTASASERAALREAVQPVFDELDRDSFTREVLRAIRAARGRERPSTLAAGRCPGGQTSTQVRPSKLEGRWTTGVTREELLDAGLSPKQVSALFPPGRPEIPVLAMQAGHLELIDLNSGDVIERGTYDVDGDTVRVVFATGIAFQAGRVYELRWSVYRDSLTLSPLPGSDPVQALTIRPWSRMR